MFWFYAIQFLCHNKDGVFVVPNGYSRGGSGRDPFPPQQQIQEVIVLNIKGVYDYT